jgi:hypothetical protein
VTWKKDGDDVALQAITLREGISSRKRRRASKKRTQAPAELLHDGGSHGTHRVIGLARRERGTEEGVGGLAVGGLVEVDERLTLAELLGSVELGEARVADARVASAKVQRICARLEERLRVGVVVGKGRSRGAVRCDRGM